MKILYIECAMGAAGDMLTAALAGLIEEPGRFLPKIAGVETRFAAGERRGLAGLFAEVSVNGESEDGHHHHRHVPPEEIARRIVAIEAPERVLADVREIYASIAEAEAAAHGVPVHEVHLHELGAMDAIADAANASALIRAIAPDRIVVSPVAVGFGTVSAAHGALPVPAPATASLLMGVPIYAGEVEGELTTPTGAALIRHFADGFGNMPAMAVSAAGIGLGSRDYPRANAVRVFLGEAESGSRDSVMEISCNVDDMTGEAVAFASERLWESGALDVWTAPIYMKKSRPAFMITALTRPGDADAVARAMLAHTTTFGARLRAYDRMILDRRFETAETPFGSVTAKIGEGFGARKAKAEFDSAAAAIRREALD
ncbi:MAG: nickel pincer cofactor biosynthesis protein LarC [Clostridiales bacterium]|jgi:uncharacterized protein (TIGR00299 family) protein|nr:nickel pincer cofactor biosynthesis protein LarC [Clostridiales bacterium]